MNRKSLYSVILVIGIALLVAASTTAWGEEFYKGKNLRIIVAFSPGGGFDTYTRLIARHISKYILLIHLFLVFYLKNQYQNHGFL